MNRLKASKNDARLRSSELHERLHKLGRLCELVRSEANQAIEESRPLHAECERLDQLLIEFRKASWSPLLAWAAAPYQRVRNNLGAALLERSISQQRTWNGCREKPVPEDWIVDYDKRFLGVLRFWSSSRAAKFDRLLDALEMLFGTATDRRHLTVSVESDVITAIVLLFMKAPLRIEVPTGSQRTEGVSNDTGWGFATVRKRDRYRRSVTRSWRSSSETDAPMFFESGRSP